MDKSNLIPDELANMFAESDAAAERRLDSDPNNGKAGFWRVVGMRHSAIAKASSAREARDKAFAAEMVGDWEFIEVEFIGEEFPDVVRC